MNIGKFNFSILRAGIDWVARRFFQERRGDRPGSARDLEEALARRAQSEAWTVNDAEDWWKANLAGIEDMPLTPMGEKTMVIAPRF